MSGKEEFQNEKVVRFQSLENHQEVQKGQEVTTNSMRKRFFPTGDQASWMMIFLNEICIIHTLNYFVANMICCSYKTNTVIFLKRVLFVML